MMIDRFVFEFYYHLMENFVYNFLADQVIVWKIWLQNLT